jgi:hypothetical protein
MFNNIKRVATVIALTGWMGVANASLIFDFSYEVPGSVLIGEVRGLVDGKDGQTQRADSLRFTTTTGIFSPLSGVEYVSDGQFTSTFRNRFQLVRRQFEFASLSFDSGVDNFDPSSVRGFYLEIFEFGLSFGDGSGIESVNARFEDFGGFVLRVAQPNPAPEPSAVFLLALGLAGVSFSRYKNKS